jgi:hypothetical protein
MKTTILLNFFQIKYGREIGGSHLLTKIDRLLNIVKSKTLVVGITHSLLPLCSS